MWWKVVRSAMQVVDGGPPLHEDEVATVYAFSWRWCGPSDGEDAAQPKDS